MVVCYLLQVHFQGVPCFKAWIPIELVLIQRGKLICGIKSSIVVCFDRNNFHFKENGSGLAIYNQEKANKDRKAKPWSLWASLNLWKQYECNEHKWIWDLRVHQDICFQAFPTSFLAPAPEQLCALGFCLPLQERQPRLTLLQPWIQNPYTQRQFLRCSQHKFASD